MLDLPKKYSSLYLAIFFSLLLFACLYRLHQPPLKFEEPRRAIVAIEMIETGNWIAPQINGAFYYNKPPLYNWYLGGFFLLFGTSEIVVRLASLVAFFIFGWSIYLVGSRYLSKTQAITSALMFMTVFQLLLQFTVIGEIDIFYSLIVFWQVCLIFLLFEKRQFWLLFTLSYLLTFVGLMTKGLPSLAFQAITLLTWFIYQKQFKKLFSLAHIVGIFVLLTGLGVYFFAYSYHNDPTEFLIRLLTESTQRTAISASIFQTLAYPLIFPLELVLITGPWTFMLLPLWSKQIRNRVFENKLLLFAGIFIVSNLLIYAISPGTKTRYLFMFIPFFLWLSVGVWNIAGELGLWETYRRYWAKFFWGILLIGGVGLSIVPWFPEVRLYPVDIVWAILCPGSLFLIAYFYKRRESSELQLLLLSIIIIRIAFDIYVLPQREISTKNNEPKEAIQALGISHDLDFYTIGQLIEQQVPMTNLIVAQKHYQWPPFAFSYYYYQKFKQPLTLTDKLTKGKQYLCHAHELPSGAKILSEYFMDEFGVKLVLFEW
ncbi:ArnT family glycosyltransferase [Penaeicola halotolerans]|uniref:ArnT family glycosyltransferase n=1 Tax=Penaeicola halotolerans TaxID=2793196 RepID=UPI001CF88FCD|nr:glycosyltransferase family 39 protein [Penaeicola halotolerans]